MLDFEQEYNWHKPVPRIFWNSHIKQTKNQMTTKDERKNLSKDTKIIRNEAADRFASGIGKFWNKIDKKRLSSLLKQHLVFQN